MELEEPTPRVSLPAYVTEAIERQDPDRLEEIAWWASELAEYKRVQADQESRDRREAEEISDEEKRSLEEREISTDPEDYDDVPAKAYIVIKETKPGYHYYYYQWREGPNSWGNEYIAPVNPKQ